MRRLLRLVNEISLGWMFAGLGGVIVGFAAIYWGLARTGAGLLHFTYETDRAVTFFDTLYFSLVTVSSLGYGDIRPVGWARMFTGAEVILGLAFFGLLVAKISSVKQDYILRRLYSDVVDAKLARFADALSESQKLYRITSDLLLDGEIDPELTTTFKAEVAEETFFYQTHQLLHDLHALMEFEVQNGGFFGDVSDAHISQLYATIQGMLKHTLILMERDPESMRAHVLDGNERWIAELNDLAEEMALLGKRGSRNSEIVEQCTHILLMTNRMRSEVLPTGGAT